MAHHEDDDLSPAAVEANRREKARQLPDDVLRLINEFENAVIEKEMLNHCPHLRSNARVQRAINEYTETKKSMLNFFREVYGLEQLP